MSTISNVEISISTVISQIEENIHTYNEVIQDCHQKIKTQNIDNESKSSIQNNIVFLKFHVEQLQHIREQLNQAKNSEDSLALSSKGQVLH